MNLNLEYYRIFYYVAKFGSITGAANELCISQPAVSQAVRLLEKNIGAALFVRNPKGVRLTKEGDVLYSYVKAGYEQILEGEHRLKKMLNLECGEIQIGASDMTLQFYLLPFLEKFHMQYPDIKVRVTNGPTPETIRYLKEGTIDFGIVSGPLEKSEELEMKPVREIEDVFVAGSRFESLKGQELSFSDITSLPLISLEKNTSTRKFIDLFLKKNEVKIVPEFELATSDMIVQFALRNLGIGLVVKDFAKPYLESGELFTLSFKEQIPKRNFCIVTNKKDGLSNAAGKLLAMMEQSTYTEG
ncbi:MAG: LysR family transcriptional regulator [Lachnospiraceae bacterium]|nr:LysR family transcriptional regulator [Lachnospiraceae bacterium]